MESRLTPHDLAKVDESIKQDPDRWVDSYVNNNATSLHNRAVEALVSTNGHSVK